MPMPGFDSAVFQARGFSAIGVDFTHERFFPFWQPDTLDALLEAAVFEIIDGWPEDGERDSWLVGFARKG